MNRRDICAYLDYLRRRATELASKDAPTEDDLRVINIEVRKLLERLDDSRFEAGRFVNDVASLKCSVDESRKPKRHWVFYTLVYGILRFVPGAIVVHQKEKWNAVKRRRELIEFGTKVEQLSKDLDGYGLFTDT
ncbi:MAG: hypothetical protein OEN01_14505 [Candidatus Krumholzibacteria bacterium]|nr:hypothetical protein [Candidatus Krumholzibacteria bacterium]